MQEPGGSSTSAPQMPHRLLVPYASEWATVDENEMKCVNLESFSFRKADNLANGGATKEPGGSSTSMPQLPHRPPVQDALNSVTAGGNPLKFTHFPSQIAHFRRVGDRRTVRRPAARTWKARPAPLVARPTHPGVQKGEMPEMTSKWPGKASGGCAGTWAGVGGAKKNICGVTRDLVSLSALRSHPVRPHFYSPNQGPQDALKKKSKWIFLQSCALRVWHFWLSQRRVHELLGSSSPRR